MPYTTELVQELNALIRFDLDTGQQGIKVHKTADPEVIAAVHRLFSKGLITQADGGYLTSLGREAAEYAQSVLGLLTSGLAATVVAH
ncbi:MAG: TIGR02647 family protein [Betaproteobacteria bacterium]